MHDSPECAAGTGRPDAVQAAADSVGVVAIGRNEGARAVACAISARRFCPLVVFVDSGSSDGSPALVQATGAEVIALDMSRPFTAARSRNAGFDAVLARAPGIRFVQFVDGDCAFEEGWLARAQAYLSANPKVAAVFGRRRERHPEASIYNLMCDIGWATPAGVARYCGGDVMIRVAALQQVGRYREDLIAGEEPELCVRLRAAGWTIVCLDAPMTLHDAAMTRFSQWWRRTVRTGYAFTEGTYLHGAAPEYHWVRETLRIAVWGVAIPVIELISLVWFGPVALALLLIYPLQFIRLYRADTVAAPSRFLRVLFGVVCRFPEAVGQLQFLRDWVLGRRSGLIEYK